MSRKGCAAAPGFQRSRKDRRGRFAALSRRKAAPTGGMRIPTWKRPPNENATAYAVAFFSATGSFPVNARQPAELRALPR
ncbi:hypothetical protein DMX06_05780 [Pseudomonas mosselii]|nr:hypothetical protein DMX06_05780 [Pseudomonas mosselii]